MWIWYLIGIKTTLPIDVSSSVLVAFSWLVFFVGAHPLSIHFFGTDRRRRLGLGKTDAIWRSALWNGNILLIKRKLGRQGLRESRYWWRERNFFYWRIFEESFLKKIGGIGFGFGSIGEKFTDSDGSRGIGRWFLMRRLPGLKPVITLDK